VGGNRGPQPVTKEVLSAPDRLQASCRRWIPFLPTATRTEEMKMENVRPQNHASPGVPRQRDVRARARLRSHSIAVSAEFDKTRDRGCRPGRLEKGAPASMSWTSRRTRNIRCRCSPREKYNCRSRPHPFCGLRGWTMALLFLGVRRRSCSKARRSNAVTDRRKSC